MSDRAIEKTFVVAVPPARAWEAFTDPAVRTCWDAPKYEIDLRPGGSLRWEIPPWPPVDGEVLEVEPERLLRHSEAAGMLPDATEVTVVFESVDGGTRITITHSGFGDGPEWGDARASHSLGWSASIFDLVLYLMQGVVAQRFCTPWRTTLGLVVEETEVGLRVLDVPSGGYAEAVGMEPGDVVLRIGGVPIFTRSDLWNVQYGNPVGARLEAEFARGSAVLVGSDALRPNVPARA